MKDRMKWIKCSEELPEDESMVIIFPQPDFDESGRIITAFYAKFAGGTNGVQKDNWYCFTPDNYEFRLTGITHWMKLPENPI